VIDTRAEHSAARVRPSRSNSLLGLACARRGTIILSYISRCVRVIANQGDDKTTDRLSGWKVLSKSYRNYKHTVRQASKRTYTENIYSLSLSLRGIFCYNQRPGKSFTLLVFIVLFNSYLIHFRPFLPSRLLVKFYWPFIVLFSHFPSFLPRDDFNYF